MLPPYIVGSTASYASRALASPVAYATELTPRKHCCVSNRQNIDLFKKPKLKKEVPNSKSINVQTLTKKIYSWKEKDFKKEIGQKKLFFYFIFYIFVFSCS
jgi:hypothetical protein